MMIVAIGTFVIAFPEALSLKDKRQILRSMKDRVRAKFNASIAEVDNNDDWNNGTIGVSIVANDKVYLEQVAAKIDALLADYSEAEILDSYWDYV